jgi:hypothetical protein
MEEKKKARKPERKRRVGRHRHGWKDDIKINLDERDRVACTEVLWLSQGAVAASVVSQEVDGILSYAERIADRFVGIVGSLKN